MSVEFTPEVIVGIVGVFLTLVFNYFPSLNVLYGGLKTEVKSLIMLGLLVVTSLVIYFLALYGIIQTSAPVDYVTLIKVLLAAIISNQAAYKILPQPTAVVDAKAVR